LAISRTSGLRLVEAKQILARLQRAVVQVQAEDHMVLRPDCCACGQACHVKDWRLHRVATLFGTVAVRLPRFRCAECGHGETGIGWLSYCWSTPELDHLRARVSALMPYRMPPTFWGTFCRSKPAEARRH
jgi:hypothetical protein